MARKHLYIGELRENRLQFGSIVQRDHSYLVITRNDGILMEVDVHTHDDGRRLVRDVSQVLLQPLYLRGHDITIVITVSDRTLGSTGIDITDIIEHDIMDIAQIKRVISRANVVLERLFGTPIVSYVGVIVMVARKIEHRTFHLVYLLHSFGQSETAAIPIQIPAQVTQRHAVDTGTIKRLGCYLAVHVVQEIIILHEVVRTVGQVEVCHDEELMTGVVDSVKHEVLLFAHRSRCCQTTEKLRLVTRCDVGLIATRHGNEHIAVRFLRRKIVNAVIIGLGHFKAVGHHDTGHSTTFTRDTSLDGHTFLVRHDLLGILHTYVGLPQRQ